MFLNGRDDMFSKGFVWVSGNCFITQDFITEQQFSNYLLGFEVLWPVSLLPLRLYLFLIDHNHNNDSTDHDICGSPFACPDVHMSRYRPTRRHQALGRDRFSGVSQVLTLQLLEHGKCEWPKGEVGERRDQKMAFFFNSYQERYFSGFFFNSQNSYTGMD